MLGPIVLAGGLWDIAGWPSWLLWLLAAAGSAMVVMGVWDTAKTLAERGRRPLVSLLLVVENEEATVEGTLRRLVARYGSPAGESAPRYELVVVDAGSSDDTPAILARSEERYHGFLRAVRLEADPVGSCDRSAAVKAGFDSCRGRVSILLNACDRWLMAGGHTAKGYALGAEKEQSDKGPGESGGKV